MDQSYRQLRPDSRYPTRLKDEFVSNVSHALRTPIANVKLYIGLLTRGRPEKYDEYLQTLRREAARLEKLIEHLLDLSRLDLGRQPVLLAAVDVNQLAAQLVADRTALAASRQLLIDYRAENLPARRRPIRSCWDKSCPTS